MGGQEIPVTESRTEMEPVDKSYDGSKMTLFTADMLVGLPNPRKFK
jgi:hypothetical protein